MPYVNIQITDESVTRAQKQELVTATTSLLRDVLGKDPATTFVVIDEVPTDNWGVGGELVTDIRARRAKTSKGAEEATVPLTTTAPVARDQLDHEAIVALLNDYFDGLFEGDVAKLRGIFHEDAWLKANNYRKTRDEWLEAVATRPAPRDEGMEFKFNIQSLEIVGDQAMAKVDVPLPAAHFIDFLGLLKEDGRWRIVNKMYTIL